MIRVLGEEHPDALAAMNNLAATLRVQSDLAGARRFQERVLEVGVRLLGEEHPSTLGSMNNLAATLTEQGDHARAQRLQEQVLEASTRVLGEEHSATLTSLGNLAATLQARGEREAAIRLLRKCLPRMRKVLGEEHPTTLAIAKALSGLEAELQGPPPLAQAQLPTPAREGRSLFRFAGGRPTYRAFDSMAASLPFNRRCRRILFVQSHGSRRIGI
jgi:tetratricopeptide (TPR) repeat protein